MLLELVCFALEEAFGAFRRLRFRFQVERDQGLEGAEGRFLAGLKALQLSEAEAMEAAQLVPCGKALVKGWGHWEAVAVALARPREAWHVAAAGRLVAHLDGSSPAWLLRHALRWPEVDRPLEALAESYGAGRGEVLVRRLLLEAARKGQGCWSFRAWGLLPWRHWRWDLEQRRVRSTLEHFRFHESIHSEQEAGRRWQSSARQG